MRLPSLVRPTRKLWREGNVEQFLLSTLRVEPISAEAGCALLHTSVFPSRMHNERCTSGSEGGQHQNPTAAMPHGADARPYFPINWYWQEASFVDGRGYLHTESLAIEVGQSRRRCGACTESLEAATWCAQSAVL